VGLRALPFSFFLSFFLSFSFSFSIFPFFFFVVVDYFWVLFEPIFSPVVLGVFFSFFSPSNVNIKCSNATTKKNQCI